MVLMATTMRDWEMEQMFGKEKKESGTKKEEKMPDVSCRTCCSKATKRLDLKIDKRLGFEAEVIAVYLCEHCNGEITKDCEIRAERDRIKNGY